MHSLQKHTMSYFLLALTAVSPLAALIEPQRSAIRDKSFRHPNLYIGNQLQPATESRSSQVAHNLANLDVSPSGAYLDRRSGSWATLFLSEPLLPGNGRGNDLSWENAPQNHNEYRQRAWQAFFGYLTVNQSLLGIDINELTSPGNVTIHNGGDLIQIHIRRQISSVPVRDSFITGIINHGNLILYGANNWGAIQVSTTPSITREAAISAANDHLGAVAAEATWRKESLVILPMAVGTNPHLITVGTGYSFRLAWVLRPAFASDPLGDWEALVDAHSGQVLSFEDHTKYAHASEGGHAHASEIELTTRVVEGGVLPISNDGTPPDGVEVLGYPMPFADMTNDGTTSFADAGGNLLACVNGDVTTELNGQYLQIIDTCGAISETTSGEVLDLGVSGGTDCAVPPGGSPGNTRSSRSGYYELNRSIEWGRSHLPNNTWLRGQLPATMNINSSCGATGGAGGVNFFRSGGGCSNTGELAGVFVHEWGHGMDASDATPGFANPAEGIADAYAALRLNTSCMGRNFRPGVNCTGYGDPCTSCTGVRDIDWANRASGLPHDIAWIDANCTGGTPGPCGGAIHCEGAVYAESVWDLFNRDLPSEYGMSIDTARELTTRLNFVGAGGVTNFFQCVNGTGMGDGCNADSGYLQFLAADDDNGDLSDGTPHMQGIFDAYDRHGIACPTPTVQDSGCTGTPTVAPNVTATPQDRGVDLTWDPVAGATSYRVFRTEGVFDCEFGKIWVGDTTETSFTDTGLKNGQEHYYIVTAMGNGDSCFGPASSCTTVTPAAGPNLSLDPEISGVIGFLSGDGDVFLDNCEEVEVTLGIRNIGTGTATNVQILDVRSASPSIAMSTTSPLPDDISANLSECDVAETEVSFVIGSLGLNDTVDLEVDFTSDEISPNIVTQVLRLSLAGTEGDVQNFETKTFSFEDISESWQVAEGIFDRTDTGGGDGTTWFMDSSDGLDFQCDRIRSPVIGISSTTTMEMWNNYDIEPLSAGTWYDRANIGLIDADGNRTLLTPDGGRPYNADSSGPGNFGGCNDPEEGWADVNPTWGTSSWSDTAMQTAIFDGEFVRLEVIYGTDAALANRGFWFDQVTLTDIDLQVDDTQEDVCDAIPNPDVTIVAPANGSIYSSGSRIPFAGFAIDAQEGELTDRLRWTSSLTSSLGVAGCLDGPPGDMCGCFFVDSSDFAPGTYTVTATAQDDEGFIGSDTTTFTVTAQPKLAEPDHSLASELTIRTQTTRQTSNGTRNFAATTSSGPCPLLGFRVNTSRPIHRIGPMGLEFTVAEEGCVPSGYATDESTNLEDVIVFTEALPFGVDFIPTADGCVESEGEIHCNFGTVYAGTSERADAFICIGESSSGFSLTATADASNADPVTVILLELVFADSFESGDTSAWSITVD